MQSHLSVTRSGSKWCFGKAQRGNIAAGSLSPGPGAYATRPKAFDVERPRFHMGEKAKDLRPATNVPGTGHYEPSARITKKSPPAFSMKVKLASSLTSVTGFVPGPGNYQVRMANKRSAPQYGFGSSTRETGKGRKLLVPGPGAYMLRSTIGDLPAHAMPNRGDEHKYV